MNIVLIPGMWLDGSSWDLVVPVLEQAGHRVHALTLPGMESKDADRSTITLRDHVDAVVQAIDALDPADAMIVLVGHSAGAAIGYAAIDARPDRIARAVYVGGFPVGAGDALADGYPAENGEVPLPDWSDFEDEELADLDDAARADFRARAIPTPERSLATRNNCPTTNAASRRSAARAAARVRHCWRPGAEPAAAGRSRVRCERRLRWVAALVVDMVSGQQQVQELDELAEPVDQLARGEGILAKHRCVEPGPAGPDPAQEPAGRHLVQGHHIARPRHRVPEVGGQHPGAQAHPGRHRARGGEGADRAEPGPIGQAAPGQVVVRPGVVEAELLDGPPAPGRLASAVLRQDHHTNPHHGSFAFV